MLTNAGRFLDAYNRIDRELAPPPSGSDYVAFSKRVRESKRLHPKQRDILLDFAALRNAIVHSRRSDDGRPIADPRDEVVEEIESLALMLEDPPKVISALKLQAPRVFMSADNLATFLDLVKTHDFSQAPVADETESLGLITTNAVSRWLADHYDEHDGGLVDSVTLSAVQQYSEQVDRIVVAKRSLTVIDAWNIFAGTEGRTAPAAVILTHNGLATEKPLGIVSSADVPAMVNALFERSKK